MINIVLYQPEIPANTGNIMRTSVALNCRLHLIEPLGFYLDEKHLRRAGMDYRKDLDMTVYHDWEDFKSKNDGEFYFFTRYGHKRPNDFNYKEVYDDGKDIYLVFGKESTGIDKEILFENLDHCIRIPMVKEARSLNLSNCVALVVYEVLRQLDYPGLSFYEEIKGHHFIEDEHQRHLDEE